MGSALLGGMLVALTITDIAAGAGLVGLAGKTLAKTIFTRGASRALLNKSSYSVYKYMSSGGKVLYSGITKQSMRARHLQHMRDPVKRAAFAGAEIRKMNDLSRFVAKGVEQVTIEKYGLIKTGLNKINSVSMLNPKYKLYKITGRLTSLVKRFR